MKTVNCPRFQPRGFVIKQWIFQANRKWTTRVVLVGGCSLRTSAELLSHGKRTVEYGKRIEEQLKVLRQNQRIPPEPDGTSQQQPATGEKNRSEFAFLSERSYPAGESPTHGATRA